LNVRGDILKPPHGTKQRYCNIEIDEKGTLKATKHDNINILQGQFDSACSWAVMEMHITAHAA
jgi:hypothetical protein